MQSEGSWMAYVGLGGNIAWRGAPPEATLRQAVAALGELGRVAATSSLWRTEPVGPVREQPAFVNGVVALETELTPLVLMGRLLDMERRFGRVRGGVPKGPRTLDLDLLLVVAPAGTPVVLDEAGLRLPHPEAARRRFVLEPLAEIAPGLRHPVLGKSVAELLTELPARECVERIGGMAA